MFEEVLAMQARPEFLAHMRGAIPIYTVILQLAEVDADRIAVSLEPACNLALTLALAVILQQVVLFTLLPFLAVSSWNRQLCLAASQCRLADRNVRRLLDQSLSQLRIILHEHLHSARAILQFLQRSLAGARCAGQSLLRRKSVSHGVEPHGQYLRGECQVLRVLRAERLRNELLGAAHVIERADFFVAVLE